MIVSLANDVGAYIGEIDRLDKIKDDMLAIKSSYDVLQTIMKDIKGLVTYTTVIGQKLPTAIQESIRQECESVLSNIVSSHSNFDHDFRQADILSLAENSLQETIKKIEIQWQNYAHEQAREPLQLLNLVEWLSEVKAQAEIYNALEERIQYFINIVPEHSEQLAIFEQNVQNLTELLNTIQLDMVVKEFLQKVIDGRATIKDLTTEIRTWCQSGDRESDFQITTGR